MGLGWRSTELRVMPDVPKAEVGWGSAESRTGLVGKSDFSQLNIGYQPMSPESTPGSKTQSLLQTQKSHDISVESQM